MRNASLLEGSLPLSQRHATVTPLLKKPSLDPTDLKNYQPVSNLTFMSKIVEKLVSAQLTAYLESNNLMPRLQSAYRRHHSTETALLRVMSDLLSAADSQRVTLLGLLDLSAAFDCVDHDILLHRLEKAVWHPRIGFTMDQVILGRSITTGLLHRSAISRWSPCLRRSTKLSTQTSAVSPVHGRTVRPYR